MIFQPCWTLNCTCVPLFPVLVVLGLRHDAEGFWRVLSFPLCSIHPRRWYLFHRLIPSWPQRSPGRCGTGDFFGCVYCSRLGWQCGPPWEVAVTDTGHRTPPPIPPTKTSGKQREAEQDLLEKDKLINMSTTIQKLLGFMLLFRCVMFAEYTIKTNCNWIIDSYRLWIRTLAFLWNSWDLYIMHGYYVFNKTEHLQTPQTSTIKH